jgi:penicillin amidase
MLGWIFNPSYRPSPGAARTIRVLSGPQGQSMRLIVDLADLDATRLAVPLGVSGHLGSDHREDQAEAWRQGDAEGQRTRLHQPSRSTLTFQPK